MVAKEIDEEKVKKEDLRAVTVDEETTDVAVDDDWRREILLVVLVAAVVHDLQQVEAKQQ